jgi:hypothetical protein
MPQLVSTVPTSERSEQEDLSGRRPPTGIVCRTSAWASHTISPSLATKDI